MIQEMSVQRGFLRWPDAGSEGDADNSPPSIANTMCESPIWMTRKVSGPGPLGCNRQRGPEMTATCDQPDQPHASCPPRAVHGRSA